MSDGPLSRACYLCGAGPGENCHQRSGARCAPHVGRAPSKSRVVPARKALPRSRMKASPAAREKRAGHAERMAVLRPQVFARDGWRCRRCGASEAELGRQGACLQAHHRLMRSHGGPDTLANLVALCGPSPAGCHGWAHAHPREAITAGFLISREAGPPGEAWGEAPEPLQPGGG